MFYTLSIYIGLMFMNYIFFLIGWLRGARLRQKIKIWCWCINSNIDVLNWRLMLSIQLQNFINSLNKTVTND